MAKSEQGHAINANHCPVAATPRPCCSPARRRRRLSRATLFEAFDTIDEHLEPLPEPGDFLDAAQLAGLGRSWE